MNEELIKALKQVENTTRTDIVCNGKIILSFSTKGGMSTDKEIIYSLKEVIEMLEAKTIPDPNLIRKLKL